MNKTKRVGVVQPHFIESVFANRFFAEFLSITRVEVYRKTIFFDAQTIDQFGEFAKNALENALCWTTPTLSFYSHTLKG